jgi:hypothetical protein
LNRVPAYPRVLLMGASPFDGDDATAITVGSLFAGWPRASLLQVCANIPFISPEISGARRIERIPVGPVSKKNGGRSLSLGPVVGVGTGSRSDRGAILTRARITWRMIRDLQGRWTESRIRDGVAAFRPDIVYALGGSYSWCRLAFDLGRTQGVPVVFHFMDDWMNTLYRDAFLGGDHARRMDGFIRRMLSRSSLHFAISSDMADEYSEQYGKKFLPFMRCIESDIEECRPDPPNHQGTRLVYCGGLHLGRWKTLAALGNAIRRRSGITLKVYAPDAHLREVGSALFDNPVVEAGGSLRPGEELPVLRRFDAAVHVESFEPRAVAYTRLSISTKIPLYFAGPLPVLAFGPRNLSSIRWIESSGAGPVVDSMDSTAIGEALELLTSQKGRKVMKEAAWSRFQTCHAAETVRAEFRGSLTSIIPGDGDSAQTSRRFRENKRSECAEGQK